MSRRQAEDGTIVIPERIRPMLNRSAWALACLLMTPWALHSQWVGESRRPAAYLSAADELDRAGAVLSEEFDRCPDHPRVLEELAALRIQQGRPAEAEILADRLIRVLAASGVSSDYGWELLAASRYLQDNTRGALRAWDLGRTRIVQSVEVPRQPGQTSPGRARGGYSQHHGTCRRQTLDSREAGSGRAEACGHPGCGQRSTRLPGRPGW